MIRRALARFVLAGAALLVFALAFEYVLDARDVARYTPGQTFATVGDARIRYRLVGREQPGATVVILTGIYGPIEQYDQMQSALSTHVPSLTYDRAGYGFSENSSAHTALEQADELVGLLKVLDIKEPVVLVAYSSSAMVARAFVGRFPEKTSALYLIDPTMPELEPIMPELHLPRRYYLRWVVRQVLLSSVGYERLVKRLHSWQGPASLVEQRYEAILARLPHSWAMAREVYALDDSSRQAIEAPIPATLPLEIAFPRHVPEDAIYKAKKPLYAELVARSSRGRLDELDPVEHPLLTKRGPGFDLMIEDMKRLSLQH
jgi:pimeloyl-ACP methyl ester carboxylesterase